MRPSFLAAVMAAAVISIPLAEGAEEWLDEMARMDSQIALMKKRSELQAEQERAQAGTGKGLALPKIVAVQEFGGRNTARVLYADGRISTVAVNDPVLPGVPVTAISAHGVVVAVGAQAKGKKTLAALEFAPVSQTTPGTPGLPPGLPSGMILPPPPVGGMPGVVQATPGYLQGR